MEHLSKILRWHTARNEILPIMWLYISKQSPIQLVVKPIRSLD